MKTFFWSSPVFSVETETGNCTPPPFQISGHTLRNCIMYLHLIALKDKNRYLLLVFLVTDFSLSNHLSIDEHFKFLVFSASIPNNPYVVSNISVICITFAAYSTDWNNSNEFTDES